MMAQKENKARYLLGWMIALAAVLLMNVNTVHAAQKLALFNFATASDLKMEQGTKVNLAGEKKTSSWTSSNPKVVKISKSGVATALKPGKAVVSAKVDGQKEECRITVVKDAVKSSSYLKKVYRTWSDPDSGKKVTVKSGSFQKGLDSFLKNIKTENEDDVVYKKCSKITAIEEDSAGATVYFQAVGVLGGKEMTFPCVAVFTNDYEHDNYDYSLMFQPVIWMTDDGQLLYGAGFFWYA